MKTSASLAVRFHFRSGPGPGAGRHGSPGAEGPAAIAAAFRLMRNRCKSADWTVHKRKSYVGLQEKDRIMRPSTPNDERRRAGHERQPGGVPLAGHLEGPRLTRGYRSPYDGGDRIDRLRPGHAWPSARRCIGKNGLPGSKGGLTASGGPAGEEKTAAWSSLLA